MLRQPDGSTPIDPDEIGDLVPEHLETLDHLNEWEQANIASTVSWLHQRRRPTDRVLSEKFIREVHRRMFGDTWRWAGAFRRTEKNIGNVHWRDIHAQLHQLLENTKHQLADAAAARDEVAARFHHRLVQIHLFPNGNGRHARLVTDSLLASLGERSFTWGAQSEGDDTAVRTRYLDALRSADAGRFKPLITFVRT